MPTNLITPIISITLALVFYTIGVWSEHRKKRLQFNHLVFFLLGLLFDTIGTAMMSQIANASEQVAHGINWHAITGGLAIVLMLIHAIWAAIVLIKKNEKQQQIFHKFSVMVWLIWLVPYIGGAFVAMK